MTRRLYRPLFRTVTVPTDAHDSPSARFLCSMTLLVRQSHAHRLAASIRRYVSLSFFTVPTLSHIPTLSPSYTIPTHSQRPTPWLRSPYSSVPPARLVDARISKPPITRLPHRISSPRSAVTMISLPIVSCIPAVQPSVDGSHSPAALAAIAGCILEPSATLTRSISPSRRSEHVTLRTGTGTSHCTNDVEPQAMFVLNKWTTNSRRALGAMGTASYDRS
ncbi:hypothetical protein C8Q76DRAFT_327289 [Earliella scabrosa]|nr:hypothetical protein C8Q76DRAFT_327289 [Earliella scabrosa]